MKLLDKQMKERGYLFNIEYLCDFKTLKLFLNFGITVKKYYWSRKVIIQTLKI